MDVPELARLLHDPLMNYWHAESTVSHLADSPLTTRCREWWFERCDNRVASVYVHDGSDDPLERRWLTIRRLNPPWGIAPPAGHVDDHGEFVDAARAEVREEVGLELEDLEPALSGWRPGCARLPGPEGNGHHWLVYTARGVGEVRCQEDETADARWLTRHEVTALASRTVAYADGLITDEDWRRRPGLEPVHVRWAAALNIVDPGVAGAVELAAIEDLGPAVTPTPTFDDPYPCGTCVTCVDQLRDDEVRALAALRDALGTTRSIVHRVVLDRRVAGVVELAELAQDVHGAHRLRWIVDQVVRAALDCPTTSRVPEHHRGHTNGYHVRGMNDAYRYVVASHDGDWQRGVRP